MRPELTERELGKSDNLRTFKRENSRDMKMLNLSDGMGIWRSETMVVWGLGIL